MIAASLSTLAASSLSSAGVFGLTGGSFGSRRSDSIWSRICAAAMGNCSSGSRSNREARKLWNSVMVSTATSSTLCLFSSCSRACHFSVSFLMYLSCCMIGTPAITFTNSGKSICPLSSRSHRWNRLQMACLRAAPCFPLMMPLVALDSFSCTSSNWAASIPSERRHMKSTNVSLVISRLRRCVCSSAFMRKRIFLSFLPLSACKDRTICCNSW
mmetsp:Transcript_148747/g.259879  ORF Transcript_148747/g.259879 Transcript_148747/m.259879 type:complete len:214 (+) Transcript_148747:739-1380(+)